MFGEPAYKALTRYITIVRPTLLTDSTNPAVFLNAIGNRISKRQIQGIVAKVGRASLDKHVTPHQLRHSFATHLLANGAGIRVVQELLGHESPITTEIYTHLGQGELKSMYLSAHPFVQIKPKEQEDEI